MSYFLLFLALMVTPPRTGLSCNKKCCDPRYYKPGQLHCQYCPQVNGGDCDSGVKSADACGKQYCVPVGSSEGEKCGIEAATGINKGICGKHLTCNAGLCLKNLEVSASADYGENEDDTEKDDKKRGKCVPKCLPECSAFCAEKMNSHTRLLVKFCKKKCSHICENFCLKH